MIRTGKGLMGVITILIVGCAGRKDDVSLFPEYNISTMDSHSVHADSLSEFTKNELAGLNLSLLTIRQEMAQLQDFQNRISIAQMEELEIRIAILTEAFKDLHSSVLAIKELPQIEYGRPILDSVITNSQRSTSALLGSDEYGIYRRALEAYRTGFYVESRQLFYAVIEKYPKGRFVDHAYYWAGLTLFAEKEYRESIKAFEELEKFQGSEKQDDALFKKALAYYKLEERESSRELFQKLVSEFPASSYSERASLYIDEISQNE